MRTNKIIAALALSLALTTGTAQAQDGGVYANIGTEFLIADAGQDDFNSGNLVARVGYEISNNFAIEGQGALGVLDDEFTDDFDGTTADVGVGTSFGGFLVAKTEAGDDLNIFARLGYHATEISVSSGSVSVGVDTDGFAGGAGIEYMLSASSGVRIEATYYDFGGKVDGENIDGSAIGLGASYLIKF